MRRAWPWAAVAAVLAVAAWARHEVVWGPASGVAAVGAHARHSGGGPTFPRVRAGAHSRTGGEPRTHGAVPPVSRGAGASGVEVALRHRIERAWVRLDAAAVRLGAHVGDEAAEPLARLSGLARTLPGVVAARAAEHDP